MLIGIDTKGIQNWAHIVEPVVNREASSYILNNYHNIVGIIRGYDISDEKANDLLHDVYISIVEDEENGEGFNMEYGFTRDDVANKQLMSVQQFVLGRIKLYSKNLKYRTDIIEATRGNIKEAVTYYETVLDAKGNPVLNKDGTPKKIKRTETKKKPIMMLASAASFDEHDDTREEKNDNFQKAYASASICDSADAIAEELSLREQIDFCIDICSRYDINIMNILKNIDTLAGMLGDLSKKKKSADSIFSRLTEIAEYHTEFGETLMAILRYSADNKAIFNDVLSTY